MVDKHKIFSLGEVVSIMRWQIFHPLGIERIWPLVNFITQNGLCEHEVPSFIEKCKVHVESQLPNLMSNDLDISINDINFILKYLRYSTKKEVLEAWIRHNSVRFGNSFTLTPISHKEE